MKQIKWILFFISASCWAQTTISSGVLKASVTGSEKIPVSGLGHPVINSNLIYTFSKARLDSFLVSLTAPKFTLGSDATGDIFYRKSNGFIGRLGVGSNGQVLTLAAGLPSWAAASGGGWPLTGSATLTGAVTIVQGGFNTTFTGTGKVTFSPSATISGINTGSVATDPSAPANGDLWHNSTFKAFGFRSDGYTAYLWSDQYENNAFGLRVFDPAKIVYGTAAHNSGIGSGAFLNCTTCKNNVVNGQNGTLTTGSYNELTGLITVFNTGNQNNWSGYDIGPDDGSQSRTMSLSNTVTARNIQANTFLSSDPGFNNHPSEGTVGIRIMPENVGIVNGTDNSSITQLHIYSAGNVAFSAVMDAGQSPFLIWNSRGAASNVKMWTAWTNTGGDWKLSTVTDDGGTTADKLTMSRTGNLTIGTTNSIVGTATNNSATAGNIGEEVNSAISTYTNYTTTATYQAVTSITLTAGDWDITGFLTYSSNSATITAASNAVFLIGTTTASATGVTEGVNIAYIPQAALLGTSKFSDVIGPYRVSLSGSTTYYLNTQATFTIGNPQYVGSLRARRIR